MRDLKSAFLLGPGFGLALFVAERSIVARVHLEAMPGGDEVAAWLGSTAAIYLAVGGILGGLLLILPPVRRQPWLVAHLATGLVIGLAVALLPNWYGTLLTAAVAGAATHLLWLPMRRWPLSSVPLLGALALIAAVLCVVRPPGVPVAAPTTSTGPGVEGPDIVLVVLDTVRRDRVSAYGGPHPTTPAFDSVAARGALVEGAYVSSPWSLPSHVTLFTGLSPGLHGAHYEHPRLEAGAPTLAELLAERGYRTVGVSANPWINRANGSARGFEEWHDTAPVHDVARCFVLRWLLLDRFARTKGGEQTAERALAALTRDDDRPLFLFANVFEAHSPYDAVPAECGEAFLPDDTDRREVRRLSDRLELAQTAGASYRTEGDDASLALALYDGAVHCADRILGQILDGLPRPGRPTVTVVLSDHGESLGEHDLVGHHYGLYDSLIRVPMAVALDGEIRPGSRVAGPVRGVDLLPTVLDYAGVSLPPQLGIEGRSRRGHLAGRETDAEPGDLGAYAEHYTPVFILEAFRLARPAGRYDRVDRRRRAIFTDGYRFEEDSRGERRLFDLERDPGERTDLLVRGELPDVMPDLLDRMAARPAWPADPDTAADPGPPATGLDERTLEYLRELGYVP